MTPPKESEMRSKEIQMSDREDGKIGLVKFKTILADPPWEMGKFGTGRDKRPGRVYKIGAAVPTPYPTMSTQEICTMDVKPLCDVDAHLWLWATNKTLHDAFHVMEAWGFRYLNTITFRKPSGVGAWFINRTQHVLFGYRGTLRMGPGRYSPTDFTYIPTRHSRKPDSSYTLFESISAAPRIELFARPPIRHGWSVWGNEVGCDVQITNGGGKQ